MKSFFRNLYLNNRLFLAIGVNIFMFLLGFAYPVLFPFAKIAFYVILSLTVAEIFLLFVRKEGFKGRRDCAEKFSNGDENPVKIFLKNNYLFGVRLRVIDEVPIQFQYRDLDFRLGLGGRAEKTIQYSLRPVKRGEYAFGTLNIYVTSTIGFASRRYSFDQNEKIAVYPSYMQMRKYELLAISNRLSELGIKKVRRIGQAMEFEQIKEYVLGDDIRRINWKATARKNNLMVNHYTDEKSQQVYSIIDKGRVMRMPFEGMSLLDYAINASLVISNIAIRKEDKAGIITFNNKINTVLPAGKMGGQMQNSQEILYNQKTNYKESSLDLLYATVKRRLNQRSLIILYTNFETLNSLQRQLPYLLKLAKSHVLVVIFFENTELKEFLTKTAVNTEEIYMKTIAEKFAYEKKLIVKELRRYGIYAVLTTPQNLTVNTINTYLELKGRGVI
ncbi:MAG: DUF58 domain-containing protein [Verrucomicrobia bacterium]|nr:DUF58 domain-containing protein [Cytophagales bacterium]